MYSHLTRRIFSFLPIRRSFITVICGVSISNVDSLVLQVPSTVRTGDSAVITWTRDDIDVRSFVLKVRDLETRETGQDQLVDSAGSLRGNVEFRFAKQGFVLFGFVASNSQIVACSAFTIEAFKRDP